MKCKVDIRKHETTQLVVFHLDVDTCLTLSNKDDILGNAQVAHTWITANDKVRGNACTSEIEVCAPRFVHAC